MKNTLKDLNYCLFEQLERLNDDEELKSEENFSKELKRAKAITGISTSINNNAKTILDAQKLIYETGNQQLEKTLLLGNGNEKVD